MRQFISFIKKEFYHIFRDKRTLLILLVMPLLLIILFGYAVTTEIKQVPIAVWDQSRNEVTGKIIAHLQASEYFELYTTVTGREEMHRLFREGKINMVVVFPPRYASLPDAPAQIVVDASDPNQATQLTAYATAIITSARAESGYRNSALLSAGVTPVVHLLYNPLMKGAYNFVPGVMGLILILICAIMTSVGIVKEKETGTLEVLLVSPMKPFAIILAKAVPYLLISLVNIATILCLSYFLLKVPMAGSPWLVIALSVLYAIVSLCLGLLISTIADTQQAAMLISALGLMLPVMLLSGMIFPVENMPEILQWLSTIVPAKWYISALKDVMIKGVGTEGILKEAGILCMMVAVLLLVSVKRFKIRL